MPKRSSGSPPEKPDLAKLRFTEVTRKTRADFENLFEAPGGPKYCWCMAWRHSSREHGSSRQGNVEKSPRKQQCSESSITLAPRARYDDTPKQQRYNGDPHHGSQGIRVPPDQQPSTQVRQS